MKEFTGSIRSLIVSLVLFACVPVAFAWTSAPSNPPSNNVEAPINVSASNQIKQGNLGVGGLAVFGNFQLIDGTQGAGKVLMSDANGKASWQDLPVTTNTVQTSTNTNTTTVSASVAYAAGNNSSLFKKVATLSPGTYTVTGSGSTYNTGGGGLAGAVLLSGDYPDGGFPTGNTELGTALTGFTANDCTGCGISNAVRYGKGSDSTVFVYNRNGYNDGPWSIPAGTTFTLTGPKYVYALYAQGGSTGSLVFTGTSQN